MGGFKDWLDRQPFDAACCPDPEAEGWGGHYVPDRCDDDAITAHGYDSRATPVDTLMAGPVSMGLRHAYNMEFGDYV